MPRNEGIKATVKLLGCFASLTLVYTALGDGSARPDRSTDIALSEVPTRNDTRRKSDNSLIETR
jgi:hypothetical protein